MMKYDIDCDYVETATSYNENVPHETWNMNSDHECNPGFDFDAADARWQRITTPEFDGYAKRGYCDDCDQYGLLLVPKLLAIEARLRGIPA